MLCLVLIISSAEFAGFLCRDVDMLDHVTQFLFICSVSAIDLLFADMPFCVYGHFDVICNTFPQTYNEC